MTKKKTRKKYRPYNTDLIERIWTVPMFLEFMGYPTRDHGNSVCPFCPPEKHRDPTLSLKETVWYCHRCKIGGGIFQLAQKLRGGDFPDACGFLARSAPGGMPEDYRRSPEPGKAMEEKQLTPRAVRLEHRLLQEDIDRMYLAEEHRYRLALKKGEMGHEEWENAMYAMGTRWFAVTEAREWKMGADLIDAGEKWEGWK